MEQIETYIYEDTKEIRFLGRGKFNAMPREGETIYPIGTDLVEGTVTRICNWNDEPKLSWQGITCIYVTLGKKVNHEELMKPGK